MLRLWLGVEEGGGVMVDVDYVNIGLGCKTTDYTDLHRWYGA
jgi:hypothetical protein